MKKTKTRPKFEKAKALVIASLVKQHAQLVAKMKKTTNINSLDVFLEDRYVPPLGVQAERAITAAYEEEENA